MTTPHLPVTIESADRRGYSVSVKPTYHPWGICRIVAKSQHGYISVILDRGGIQELLSVCQAMLEDSTQPDTLLQDIISALETDLTSTRDLIQKLQKRVGKRKK